MNDSIKNEDLEVELVIRARGYQITLDVRQRIVSVAKIDVQPDWQISLRCKEGECAIC